MQVSTEQNSRVVRDQRDVEPQQDRWCTNIFVRVKPITKNYLYLFSNYMNSSNKVWLFTGLGYRRWILSIPIFDTWTVLATQVNYLDCSYWASTRSEALCVTPVFDFM